MAWSIEELGVALTLPHVFPNSHQFSGRGMMSNDEHAMYLAVVADYLDAGVEDGCIPHAIMSDIREVGGQLEVTVRIGMPVVIDVAAE